MRIFNNFTANILHGSRLALMLAVERSHFSIGFVQLVLIWLLIVLIWLLITAMDVISEYSFGSAKETFDPSGLVWLFLEFAIFVLSCWIITRLQQAPYLFGDIVVIFSSALVLPTALFMVFSILVPLEYFDDPESDDLSNFFVLLGIMAAISVWYLAVLYRVLQLIFDVSWRRLSFLVLVSVGFYLLLYALTLVLPFGSEIWAMPETG